MTLFGDKLVDVMSSFYASVRSRVRVKVEGYDTSLSEMEIRKALLHNFESCGRIHSLEIPRDPVNFRAIRSSSYVFLLGEGAEEKAMSLNGKDFGGWIAAIEVLPREFNEGTPDELAAKNVARFQRSRSDGICVTGFDPSLPEDDVKTALSKHFSSCGMITEVSIRKSRAFIYLYGLGALHRAMKLSGTDFGGWTPVVKILRPKPENNCSVIPYGGPPFGIPPFGGSPFGIPPFGGPPFGSTSGAAAPDGPLAPPFAGPPFAGPPFGSTSGAAAPDGPLAPPFAGPSFAGPSFAGLPSTSGAADMDFEYSGN